MLGARHFPLTQSILNEVVRQSQKRQPALPRTTQLKERRMPE